MGAQDEHISKRRRRVSVLHPTKDTAWEHKMNTLVRGGVDEHISKRRRRVSVLHPTKDTCWFSAS